MIRGFFVPDEPYPYVQMQISVPGLTDGAAPIDFLVDTGAAVTVVHPRDVVRRLGVSTPRLERYVAGIAARTLAGVGGPVEYYRVPAEIGVHDSERRLVAFRADIHLARPTQWNRRTPSLLGWDLILHFRLTVDGPAREVTLDPARDA